VLSILAGRYSGSADSSFESDIHEIAGRPFADYLAMTEQAELSDAFWNVGLVAGAGDFQSQLSTV
jgi:hypothetical protein